MSRRATSLQDEVGRLIRTAEQDPAGALWHLAAMQNAFERQAEELRSRIDGLPQTAGQQCREPSPALPPPPGKNPVRRPVSGRRVNRFLCLLAALSLAAFTLGYWSGRRASPDHFPREAGFSSARR